MTGTPAPHDRSRADKQDVLHRTLYRGIRVHHILLICAFLILVGLGAFFIIVQAQAVEQTAIASYQLTELEIVREAARSIREYVYVQTITLGRTDIPAIEQEIFLKFIEPIHLLENGDAWIYAPDHVVFDLSSDFPDEYRGKSMAQIFEIQKTYGASHYEEMTADVSNAREGVGYYIWLPEKGAEIAAWTPVTVGVYTWTVGLSTPLPEILLATGATTTIMTSWFVFFLGVLLAVILFAAWLRSDIRRGRSEEDLLRSNEKLRLLSSITRHDIQNQLLALRGFLELSEMQSDDETVKEYIGKALHAAAIIERDISFTKLYQDIGMQAPAWHNVQESVEKLTPGLLPASITCTTDIDGIEVNADPLFEKVIFTLIDNTVRHAAAATAIRLSYRVSDAGDLVLAYEDNGPGIPDEDKERIFERGFGKHTGFGLFLAREILAITGISIRETGTPGEGARFEIAVPK
ncbi:MAG: HAMP domain-containing histidine kinase, partial [Methanomicrobiales archaeon]|nr:HAMP domain-containing histidine kinase [Methanomicrobiales archaeon]